MVHGGIFDRLFEATMIADELFGARLVSQVCTALIAGEAMSFRDSLRCVFGAELGHGDKITRHAQHCKSEINTQLGLRRYDA